MDIRHRGGIAVLVLLLAACGGGGTSGGDTHSGSPSDPNVPPVTGGSRYQPALAATWQWQLQSALNTSYVVDIYDVDLVETPKATIADLHAAGRKVICYFSGGSYEDWRPDKDQFNAADLGNDLDGWPGERWLDIRSTAVRTIMLARLDLAKDKGCDGVEPDNVEGYNSNSGFNLTASDQLAYNRFLANAAHDRVLAVALKNDLDQVADLVSYFDFAVNEECFAYNECDALAPFTQAGKPVLQAEYDVTYVNHAAARANLCTQSLNRQFSTLVLPLALDDSIRYSCR
jgi:hypothetical protein